MSDQTSPIELQFKPAGSGSAVSLRTFSSYSFDRNMLVPASAFRFTAEGLDPAYKRKIRSADLVELFVRDSDGDPIQLATGFIDETDMHTTATSNEYVLSGRDTAGQLVDNAAVDDLHRPIFIQQTTILGLTQELIKNTRLPQVVADFHTPNGKILFQTNPGETKINALQRYLEYANCLVWALPNGTIAVGKPNMAQSLKGRLIVSRKNPELNNVLEIRSRRNTNTAIRKIAVPLQNLVLIDPTEATIVNTDKDVRAAAKFGGGRSVFRAFSLGNGQDAVNTLVQASKNGNPQEVGHTLARRELAHSNMQVLEVEAVMRGHVNENEIPYQVDQIYRVTYEEDGIDEEMYCYAVRYDLTKDRGRTTTLKLVRLGTIVADVPIRGA